MNDDNIIEIDIADKDYRMDGTPPVVTGRLKRSDITMYVERVYPAYTEKQIAAVGGLTITGSCGKRGALSISGTGDEGQLSLTDR